MGEVIEIAEVVQTVSDEKSPTGSRSERVRLAEPIRVEVPEGRVMVLRREGKPAVHVYHEGMLIERRPGDAWHIGEGELSRADPDNPGADWEIPGGKRAAAKVLAAAEGAAADEEKPTEESK